MLFSMVDRYVGRSVLSATAMVLFVAFLLLTFLGFVEGLRDLGKGNFHFPQLVYYVLMSQPENLQALFPMAALIGSTLGLAWHAASSELVALRAAGMSVWRIAAAVLKSGMLVVLLGIVMGEYVAPLTEDLAQRSRAEALGTGFKENKYTGVWLREGDEYLNVGEVLPDYSLRRVNLFRFDELELRSHLVAERGRWLGNGRWLFEQVRESQLFPAGITASRAESREWFSTITPEALAVYTVKPEALSALNLYRYIQHLEENYQRTDRYELVFWRKLVAPVATAVMLMLAIPFVFGQLRTGSMAARAFFGLLVALGYYMFNLGFGHVALLKGLPPLLGAGLPAAVFLLLTIWLMRRVA